MLRKQHHEDTELTNEAQKRTPWQRAFDKFGLTQNALAKELGWHRSMISRRLSSRSGLIDGADQFALMVVAKRLNVTLNAEDMVPVF